MPSRRAFIKLGLLATLAKLMPPAADAAIIPFAEEYAPCAEISHDLIFKEEVETITLTAGHTATVKTEFRITKVNLFLFVFRRSQHDFQAQLDLSLAATSQTTKQARTGNFMWHIEPLAFADGIYLDPRGFTANRYELNLLGQEPCQDRTCCVYSVTPKPKARSDNPSPFFEGKIWVETADFTIIRFQGMYLPASNLKPWPAVDNYFPFDSYRTEVAPHLWLPSVILTYNGPKNGDMFFPQFEARTVFSNFKSH
jgi:hypothetical protein